MITLKDIAKRTGFSLAVVSRALNPHPDQNVAKATRERIAGVAEKMGYRPNQVASMLARGKQPSIGVFLPTPNSDLIAQLIAGLAEVANKYGFPYNLNFSIATSDYLQFLKNAHDVRNAGIITYLPYDYQDSEAPRILQDIARGGCRIVILNNHLEEKSRKISEAAVNNELGGRLAAQHLLQRGCTRFLASKSESWQLTERLHGFVSVIQEAGYDVVLARRTFETSDYLNDKKVMSELLSTNGTLGVFAEFDIAAIAMYGQLAALGLHNEIGRRIRIVGYDDDRVCRVVSPSLTSVTQPFEALGKIAMSQLLNSLINAKIRINRTSLNPKLIARQSS